MSAAVDTKEFGVFVEKCLLQDLENSRDAMRAAAALIVLGKTLPPKDYFSALFDHFADDLDSFIRETRHAP